MLSSCVVFLFWLVGVGSGYGSLKLDVGCSMVSVSRDMCFVMRVFASCFGIYFSYSIFER
jgi:hypothetical protein